MTKRKTLFFPLLACLTATFPCAAGAATILPETRARLELQGTRTSPTAQNSTTSSSSAMQVGDSSNNTVFSGLFNFDVSPHTTAIASATQILFSITPTSLNINSVGPNIRLVALTTDSDSTAGTISTDPGTIVSTIPFAGIAVDTALVFDVTGFVKDDALAGTYSSFRLESDWDQSNGGGADVVIFGTLASTDARIQIIPEPSLPLVSAISVLPLFRRKTRSPR